MIDETMTDLSKDEIKDRVRCSWAESNKLFIPYHDEEWGVPVHDDRMLFEMINLEGAQAGLSWLIILKRRESYRKAFDNFDAEKIANYSAAKQEELLKDTGIVRNRLKVNAVVENARAFLAVQREFRQFRCVYLAVCGWDTFDQCRCSAGGCKERVDE